MVWAPCFGSSAAPWSRFPAVRPAPLMRHVTRQVRGLSWLTCCRHELISRGLGKPGRGWAKRNPRHAATRLGLASLRSRKGIVHRGNGWLEFAAGSNEGIPEGSIGTRAAAWQGGGSASPRHKRSAFRLINACAFPVPGHSTADRLGGRPWLGSLGEKNMHTDWTRTVLACGGL